MNLSQPVGVLLLVSLLVVFYIGATHWAIWEDAVAAPARPHTRQARQPTRFLRGNELHRVNFQEWMNSSDAMSRLHVFDGILEGVDLVLAQHSLNQDIVARGKFQEKQMNEFCSRHNITTFLPTDPTDLSVLLQHLLYDDSRRFVFCYVPKNGCSNVKHMMLVLSGHLPPESARPGAPRPPETTLKQVHSFLNLSASEIQEKLQTYKKIVIVRHPLTRLLSAYRNKLELPLNVALAHSFPENVKLHILQRHRKKDLEGALKRPNQSTISPTFAEFLQYMTKLPFNSYNEHFIPVLNLCHPCAVHYDFYANFKTLSYDMYAIMAMLGIPSTYYPTRIGHRRYSTDDGLVSYYSRVSHGVRQKVLEVFHGELEFYYALYPEERLSHHYMHA